MTGSYSITSARPTLKAVLKADADGNSNRKSWSDKVWMDMAMQELQRDPDQSRDGFLFLSTPDNFLTST